MNVDYVIQSVIFKQPKYTPAEAKKWLKEHHYSGRKLDRTANMLRFRQMTPEKVEQYGFTEYRTKELGRSGISLVIAYKKSIEGGSLSNTFRNIWNRIRRRHQAVVVPIAEVAPPPPVLPYNTPFAANDAELAEATEIPITMAEVAPDDIEEYYTPIVKKERADLEKKYKKANTAYNVARSELIQARVVFGDISFRTIEAENRVDRTYNERQEIIEQLRDLRTREAYLPIRNRPQFDTLRWDFYRDVAFSRDYMNSQLERRLPVRDRPIRQAEVLTLGGIEGEDQSLPVKEPQYDISTFGDREEERLAEAERVYNETMEEEIEKQGMSGEDKPKGSGIYLKGFGRIMGGRIKRKAESVFGEEDEEIDPALIRDEADDDEEELTEEEITEIEEYNAYVAFILQEMDEMDDYLMNDEIDIDNGTLDFGDDIMDLIIYKRQELDRIKLELGEILDATQNIEIAELVKQYMDEYIMTETPFVEPAEWRGGVLYQ